VTKAERIETTLYRVMLRLREDLAPDGYFLVHREAVEVVLPDVMAVDRWVLDHGGHIEGEAEIDRVYVLPKRTDDAPVES
jgi:hypothetical protein